MLKKANDFKVFCITNGIKQKILSEKSDVGVTALHRIQNMGIASDKTINKLVECLSRDFNIDTTFEQILKMIGE